MDLGFLTQEDVKETRAGSGSRAKQDYWGALVLLNADGQSFDTVMAAINSSKCASCDVTLIVERKKGEPSKVLHTCRVLVCRSESNTDCNCSVKCFSAWQCQEILLSSLQGMMLVTIASLNLQQVSTPSRYPLNCSMMSLQCAVAMCIC